MTEHDNLAVARYFREGDGRIRDREWGQPGYVLKVWAMRDDGGGLADVGPEVEAELSRLLVLLNGHAAALAAARAQGAAEAFERAAKACETEAAECEAASQRWSVHQERKFESCREEAQGWRNRQAQALRDAAAIRALAEKERGK